jgi:hypothetical protein
MNKDNLIKQVDEIRLRMPRLENIGNHVDYHSDIVKKLDNLRLSILNDDKQKVV